MANGLDIAGARRIVLESAEALGAEEVAVDDALGRVLAETLESAGPLPPFDSSAMDGYAVIAGAGAELRVTAESRAGRPSDRALRPGEAIAISTGAEVPDGRDVAVVPVERIERVGDAAVRVPGTEAGANVRRAGEDARAGEVVVAAGSVLGPAELAVSAALGRTHLRCGARPRVAVLVTGDELVAAGRPLGPGQIRDSNAVALAAQAVAAGAEVVDRQIVRDDLGATVAALEPALDEVDVVCVSGGVSVGAHDHVKPALEELGVEERFWGVRLKPGKPTWFGTRRGVLVFGLPGNPVSAMVTFHLFARPALRALAGAEPVGDASRGVARLGRRAPPAPRPGASLPTPRRGRRLARPADQGAGIARPDLDGRRGRARARAGRPRRASRRRPRRRGAAPVVVRSGALEGLRRRGAEQRRRSRARARVTITEKPQSSSAPDGAVASSQTADVSLPRAELERIWTPEYLERLARTYWRFLERVSLGLLRVLYTPHSREVVLLRRPFVLLRFRAPEYEAAGDRGAVLWRIDRGLLVVPRGRGKGFLRISVERTDDPAAGPRDEATVTVRSEVSNFYPMIGGTGWF